MKEERKRQYNIIANKNWIVMKRNPGELVWDIVYVVNTINESKIPNINDGSLGNNLCKP